MGALNDKIEAEAKKDIPKYYKENTIKMYNLYMKPDELVKPIDVSNISTGRFFFFFYIMMNQIGCNTHQFFLSTIRNLIINL